MKSTPWLGPWTLPPACCTTVWGRAKPMGSSGTCCRLWRPLIPPLSTTGSMLWSTMTREFITIWILDYTGPSTRGGTVHVTVLRSPHPYYRGVGFDELDGRGIYRARRPLCGRVLGLRG